ncbi:MAG: TetR family transcriptional regulator [Sandaracinus sp.]|nr:TetR family transcriptional regulator [Sandaracinus sp.]|tara:strand:+ start:3749 stop:4351 length:603 start_codon:yes stop_codon:yes gene_type:complete
MGGRPRAFDEQTVLDRAMELFWRDGYAATSLQALLDHMGISRQSLYNAFGDKKQLYLACLDRYAQRRLSAMLTDLEGPGAGYGDIISFFESFRREKSRPASEPPRACLIGRTCVELKAEDEALREKVHQHMERIYEAFQNALTNAVDRGEIETLELAPVARHLTATLQGLGIMARSGVAPEHLGDALRVALSVIRPRAQG